MFAPIRDDVWLQDRWQRCLDDGLLDGPAECGQLSCGYSGCNLVLDLVQDLFRIANGRTDRFSGILTCGTLDTWLLGPAPPAAVASGLVDDAARIELQATADVWRQVHAWLLREAILRVLGVTAPPPAAAEHAREAFRAGAGSPAIPASRFPGAHLEVCSRRGEAVTRAFREWWDQAVELLGAFLRDRPWRSIRFLTVDQLAGELSTILCPEACTPRQPCLLARLVTTKNNQWTSCQAQRNWVLRDFPRRPWFDDMAGQLIQALAVPRRMWWNVIDVENFWHVCRWLGQLAPAMVAGLPLPPPGQTTDDTILEIDPPLVDQLVRAWEEIADLMYSRRDNLPHAQDLFARAEPRPFADWVVDSYTYWP